jgi:hypothetical protein
MNSNFVGSFYFKQTIGGNLLGEFLNNGSNVINVECATLKTHKANFVGTYDSTWDDGKLHRALLEITSLANNKYLLTWKEPGVIDYEGQGMLVDDILLGFYTKI